MTPRISRLTLAQARRIALAAQGFGTPRPQRPVTIRDVQRTIARVGQFQIDSVNVVRRAHYLPLYSRLGPYDTALLDAAAQRAPRRLFEYWGHAASLLDVTLQPALRFRMSGAVEEAWGSMRRIATEHPEIVARVRREVAARGPLTARAVAQFVSDTVQGPHEQGNWGWNWSAVKSACEWLFWAGEVTAAARNSQFERVFDLPERVLPVPIVTSPALSRPEAHIVLVRRAAAALGVASLGCLADYFRLSRVETAEAVDFLAGTGELEPAVVAGWSRPVWLWAAARRPRRIRARALVSPFDSVVFERRRLAELFGFDYRIEIYVPEAQRRHGYYVYPFLLDERFVARVDLKADRAQGRLLVRSAWGEAGVDTTSVAGELAEELMDLAQWLGVGRVVVEPPGDLAQALARAGRGLAAYH